jgi:uncharacterized protein (TIGR02271 family)
MAAHHDDSLDGTSAGGRSAGGSHLGRLRDMDDYKVADGYPDITGWDVKASDGTKIGEVKDLVVDTQAMRARYVDVELDRSVTELARDAATPGDQSDDRHVLLPIGDVRLDDAHDDVLVDGYTVAQIGALPRHGGHLTRDYETSLRSGLTGAAGAAGAGAMAASTHSAHTTPSSDDHFDYDADTHRDRYDDQRLFASRRDRAAGTANRGEARLTLSEEQLSVGKRQVEAGEVGVHKTVETEHVRESVPLMHEEVTIERHPVNAGSVRNANIGEDEIHVPVMREEAVVQKRVVPREEIIVRKHAVTEQQNVDADLRRERLDTSGMDQGNLHGTRGMSGAGSTAGTGGAADRATSSGLGDRIADKLDDVKDRVDGNPASRPGPDATDRRI